MIRRKSKMLKKILTIITLCTTLTLHATPGATGGAIDVTSLSDIVYEYDNLNRVVKATYASGESISYSYDAGGNLLEVGFDDPNAVNDIRPHIDTFTLLNSDECFMSNTCDFKIHASKGDNDLAAYAIHFEASPQRHECGSVSTYGTAEHTAPEGGPFATEEVTILPTISVETHTDIFECHDIARLQVCDSKNLCSETTVNLPTTRTDTDNDEYYDSDDAFPDNPNEWLDTDGDGVGNNADKDDDGDGMSDADEIKYGFNPLDASDANEDADNDGISNIEEIKDGSDPQDPTQYLHINTPITKNLGSYEDISFRLNAKEYKTIEFKLYNLTDDVDLYIYSENEVCSSTNMSNTNEYCKIEASKNEIINISLYSYSLYTSQYTLEAIVKETKKFVPIMMDDIVVMVPLVD